MEGFKLKIMELTDSGQFECRSNDGEHYHDISLQITCELNNDRCEIVDIGNASAKPTVPSNAATISARIDGDGHNSSNHSINATHNELNNNNLRTTTTITAISAHAVPAAAETLSARNSSANKNNNENSNVDNNDINSDADSVVVNRLVARQVVDDKSKRFRSNYARG